MDGILNVGLGEMLLILLIALLVFGPEELPRVARRVGQAVGQLRDAASEMQRHIMQESEPIRRTMEETRQDVESVARPIREVREDLTRNNPVARLQRELDETKQAVRSPFKPRSGAPDAAPPAATADTAAAEDKSIPVEEPLVVDTATPPPADPIEEREEVRVRPPQVPPIARGEISDEPDDA